MRDSVRQSAVFFMNRAPSILDGALSYRSRNQNHKRQWLDAYDNNIAENALQGVAVGRKNWLFADSDSGGEHVTVLYSLIGTCRLNNVELGKWLRYVIKHILKSRSNRAININTVHMSRLRISEPFFFCFLRAFFVILLFPGFP